jgi:ribonuclease HII
LKKLPTLEQEALLWDQGSAFVFGVDEVGRGCLAGPVCAGAVCWAPFSASGGVPADVRDSKMMTEAQRESAFGPIQRFSLASAVGYASAAEIDRWNILKATHLALARALELALVSLWEKGLLKGYTNFSFLSDGHRPMVEETKFFARQPQYREEFPLLSQLLATGFSEACFVKGDSKVYSIASASVLAKVSRDRLMQKLDQDFPLYAFGRHKGYSTPVHIEKLRKHGPCSEHRRSFSPVSESLGLFP